MKLSHLILAAACFGTACSNQNSNESAVLDADSTSASAKVKHNKPQKVDLTRYDIFHGSAAPMKIKLDTDTEKGCWRSANWRLTKLKSGDLYVTVEMLAHPMIVCTPNMLKEHKLGLEIDIPTSTSDQYVRLYVQRLESGNYKHSIEAISEKEGSEDVKIFDEEMDAESHFISINSSKGFTAYVDYQKVRACWPDYLYRANDIDERTVMISKEAALHPAIPCHPQHLKSFYTGIKLDVGNQGSLTYKYFIVTKGKHDPLFPVIKARKNK